MLQQVSITKFLRITLHDNNVPKASQRSNKYPLPNSYNHAPRKRRSDRYELPDKFTNIIFFLSCVTYDVNRKLVHDITLVWMLGPALGPTYKSDSLLTY
jgi:hypothetical protein